MGYRVAVVGATGNVGREMMMVLAERAFPIDEIGVVASARSHGSEVEFGDTGKMLKCRNIEHFDFAGWDIALFSAGGAVAKAYAPKAAAAGCVVIDNSSHYPDGPRRAARRARGERRGCGGLQGAQHHRQSELFDRAARRRAEAASRRGADQASRGRHLPVGLGCGEGGDGRTVRAEPRDFRRRSGRAQAFHQADRLQLHSAYRRVHGRCLDQGGVEDDGRDQEDSRPEDQADRDLRARAGLRRPCRGGEYRIRGGAAGGPRARPAARGALA